MTDISTDLMTHCRLGCALTSEMVSDRMQAGIQLTTGKTLVL
jgi:hypothetical protein